jgi:hypothetical protein
MIYSTFIVLPQIALSQDIAMQHAARMLTSSRIEVKGATTYDCMWVVTNKTCSSAYDNGWDGLKVLGPTSNLQIYSKESDSKIYQVNTTNNVNGLEIWLRTAADTSYSIKFNNEYLSLSYSSLYLYDIETKEIVDVTETGTSYNFTAKSNLNDHARFILYTSMTSFYSNQSVATTTKDEVSESVNVMGGNGTVKIENNTDKDIQVYLYGIDGKVIKKSFKLNSFESNDYTTELNSGIYIVRVMTDDKFIKVEKIFVK